MTKRIYTDTEYAKLTEEKQSLEATTLKAIGTPDDLSYIDVIPLYDNRYRINIYCEKKGRRWISDSFYVMVVLDGIVSNPPMTKRYFDISELAAMSS